QRVAGKLRALPGTTLFSWKHDDDWVRALDVRDFVTNALQRHIKVAVCFGAIEKRLVPAQVDNDEVPDRERFVIRPATDLLNTEPPGFIVEQLIPERGLCALVGKPGHGKTVLAHAVSMSVAAGVPLFGREVQSGPVLIIAAEGWGGLPARFRAAAS